MDNLDLKERYMEYQFLMQQLQQLQQNVSALEKHINDLNSLNENLSNLKDSKVNSEVLMPLGSGIFVKGDLKENKSVLMNVGNDICIEKTVEGAKETVEKQLGDVVSVLEQLREEIENTVQKLGSLQHEFEKLKKEED
ncbi:prefoldin subunit alpha [Candidatus Woesearchaeota archaeon]|nr:prefoldin subunit alpha [Candidatus Woesearchaeota archaeon]